MTAAVDNRAEARVAYEVSARNGEPLSGSALGARFGRSDSWGRAVIRDARVPEPDPEAIDLPAETTVPVPADSAVLPGARFYAWLGFLFGTVVSIGGNVLSAWLPVVLGTGTVHPPVVQQVIAAVWPIALLVSVEVLSRTAWKHGLGWKVTRFSGVVLVALGSAVISYGHLLAVLEAFRYGTGSYVGPLVIDGLMTVSGFALLSMNSMKKEERS